MLTLRPLEALVSQGAGQGGGEVVGWPLGAFLKEDNDQLGVGVGSLPNH